MKKKSLLILGCVLSLLSSCNGEIDSSTSSSNTSDSSTSENTSNNVVDYSLNDMVTLLRGDLNTNEINLSSKVEFSETTTKEGVSVETQNETWSIYDGQVSNAIGSKQITYSNSDPDKVKSVSDEYEKIVKVVSYPSEEDIIYFVTDYKDGTTTLGSDSAKQMFVIDSGTENSYYLLRSSVKSQLAKQVAMIASNYIISNFTGNTAVLSSLPKGYKKTENGVETYYINAFSYSYSDEDILTTIKDEFSFTVVDQKITSFKTNYSISYSRDGEDSYVNTIENEYKLSYDSRTSAPSALIDPTQYFLFFINDVEAYYYDDNQEVVVDLDKLPTKKYVRFRAKDYSPLKAVDLELYAASADASSNTSVVSIDNIYFYTEKAGEAKLTLTAFSGASTSVDVVVLPPELKSISYEDTYSSIEKVMVKNDDDTYDTIRYVYNNSTYSKIRITPTPTDADKTDIVATVDKDNMVNITSSINENTIEYTFEVLDVAEGDEFTVTFASVSIPSITKSITYTCKRKAASTDEELYAYLTSHTYNCSYDLYIQNFNADLSFSSSTEGKVIIHWATKDEEISFNFVLNDYYATVTTVTKDKDGNDLNPYYGFDEMIIYRDLKTIKLSVADGYPGAGKKITFSLVEE